MKKSISLLLSILVILSVIAGTAVTSSADSKDNEQGYYLNYPTKNEVIAKIKEYQTDLYANTEYQTKPVVNPSSYKAGSLSKKYLQNAVNTLNLCRFIAGIPSDVELSDNYTQLAQTASLVNAANDDLSHYPDKPNGMSDELYNKGKTGSGSCNLAMGYGSLGSAIVNGWMEDADGFNIDRVGHRRWILNPPMKYTGFGEVGSYSAMYAFDCSRSAAFKGDYVAWPGRNTPVEMFGGSVFSVSLGDNYDAPEKDKIKITVKSEKKGRTYTIDKSSKNMVFYVNTGGYGMRNCIIFKPDDFTQEDTISVKITGITKNGGEAPISYSVNLFSVTDITIDKTSVVMKPNSTLKLSDLGFKATCLLYRLEPDIDWRSSNGDIAEVWGDEIYAGPSVGSAVLTANSSSGKQIKITVRVDASISCETPTITQRVNTNAGIKLTWKKVRGAAKYRVFVIKNGSWTKIGDTTGTTFTYKNVKSGSSYVFTVRCVSQNGKTFTSGFNKTGWKQTFIAAPKITRLRRSGKGIRITWGKVKGAQMYRIFVKKGSKWVKLVDTKSTSYFHTPLKARTKYTYTVRCISPKTKKYVSGYDTKGKSIWR